MHPTTPSVVPLATPSLGNRSYLVHDGTEALVVDPPRDVERVEAAAEEAGVRIAAVAETHVHNDYVSGGRRLARRHGADHLLAADEQVRFDRVGVRDGDKTQVGGLLVEVLGTPGHTPGHLAYLVGTDGGDAPALFSGGSLLLGTVGRTDLCGPDLTDRLAREQVRTARRLADLLPADTTLHPTHGFGSFCASTTAGATSGTTLAEELAGNPVLDGRDVEDVARALVAGFGPVPAHYAHMADLNRTQTLGPTVAPARLDAAAVRGVLSAGGTVVDVRPRQAFADGHLAGVLGIEYGAQCATYVGWLTPWGEPLVLVGDDDGELAEAVLDLGRIGIDTVRGTSTEGAPATEAEAAPGYRRLAWEDLAAEQRAGRRPLVVDVRTRAEFAEGHLEGAVCAPVHELPELLEGLPGGEAWVHCRSGYRAQLAAGLLHARGRQVVHLDDDIERAAAAGLAVTAPAS